VDLDWSKSKLEPDTLYSKAMAYSSAGADVLRAMLQGLSARYPDWCFATVGGFMITAFFVETLTTVCLQRVYLLSSLFRQIYLFKCISLFYVTPLVDYYF